MNNPYEILNVSQNATRQEIRNGMIVAMKERKYSLQEIQLAERQLLIPAKRLAADFMFPQKVKSKRPKNIKISTEIQEISFESIDEDAFNSLK